MERIEIPEELPKAVTRDFEDRQELSGRRGSGLAHRSELAQGHRRHFHVEVDVVQERLRKTGPMPGRLPGRARF